MLKIAALTSALAIGLVSGAYAQTTGPAGQQDKAGMTNPNSDAMKKDSTTTGMSNTKPAAKTTTGPTGSGSKTESPEK
jgi:hypothetical protein